VCDQKCGGKSAMRKRDRRKSEREDGVCKQTEVTSTRGLRLLCRTAAPGVTSGQSRFLFIRLSCPRRSRGQEDAVSFRHLILLIQIVFPKDDCLYKRIEQLGDTWETKANSVSGRVGKGTITVPISSFAETSNKSMPLANPHC
jgi:hypothetical protein